MVDKAANLNGGFTPQNIQYVSTDRQAAVALENSSVDSDQPVYLVQFEGPVVAYTASYPTNEAVPTGKAMYLVVDQSTMAITDWGVIADDQPELDLSTLGPVQPITAAQ